MRKQPTGKRLLKKIESGEKRAGQLQERINKSIDILTKIPPITNEKQYDKLKRLAFCR